MAVLIGISVLLALVVLFNLTNINVAERIRELSTIKVLGFFNRSDTLHLSRNHLSLYHWYLGWIRTWLGIASIHGRGYPS